MFCGLSLGGLLAVSAAAAGAGGGAADGGAVQRIFQWRPFLAPFHAVVLHFPIGFLTVAFLLEIYRAFRPGEELRRVTALIIWLSLGTGVLSATFGLMRAGSGEYESHAVELHRAFGLAVPVATLLTLGLQRVAYRDEARRGWVAGYRMILTATVGLLVVAGHYGGNLTHGSRYLLENAPGFVRELVEDPPAAEPDHSGASLNDKQRFYQEKVQPIFAAKCYGCHGAEKQKGGYRLDRPELALKGGESGKPTIKPGDPLESHLVRLILLPPQHDDVMPPAGKQPLALDEIATLLDWIRNGASFPEPQFATATNTPVGGRP